MTKVHHDRPHLFSSFRQGERPPSVFLGAGMSWQMVPIPTQLLQAEREKAEKELGCQCTLSEDDEKQISLYSWAEDILGQLVDEEPEPPKLRLARSLGLLNDDRWFGHVNVPLRGTWPRHRVVARLAREGRWAALWSFNWDCILENALECVGFERGPPARVQPWITRFASIVTTQDFALVLRKDLLCVFKPHGCVRSLVEAADAAVYGDYSRAVELAERFMITQAELTKARQNPTNDGFFDTMRHYLRGAPILVAGWSISEPYLQDVFNDTLPPVIQRGILEELTIIDPQFQPGHERVTALYELSQKTVHFDTSPSGVGVDTDGLFLWIQTRYCLDQLASAAAQDPELLSALEDRARPVDEFSPTEFLTEWADDFVPAWTRMCWRGEVVSCAGFQPHELALERADEHIPLSLRGLPRPDLTAAARMLCSFPVDGGPWNVSQFPGAFWHQDQRRLVVPFPTWAVMSDLAALKPMLASHELSFVEKLEIWPVHYDPTEASPTTQQLIELQTRLSQVLSVPAFAAPEDIGIANDLRLMGVVDV